MYLARRYPALRFVSAFYKVLALVGFAVVIVLFFIEEVTLIRTLEAMAAGGMYATQEAQIAALLAPVPVFLLQVFGCISLYALGELIMLLIDLEYNTRAQRQARPRATKSVAPHAPDEPSTARYAPPRVELNPSKQELKIARAYDERIRDFRRR